MLAPAWIPVTDGKNMANTWKKSYCMSFWVLNIGPQFSANVVARKNTYSFITLVQILFKFLCILLSILRENHAGNFHIVTDFYAYINLTCT